MGPHFMERQHSRNQAEEQGSSQLPFLTGFSVFTWCGKATIQSPHSILKHVTCLPPRSSHSYRLLLRSPDELKISYLFRLIQMPLSSILYVRSIKYRETKYLDSLQQFHAIQGCYQNTTYICVHKSNSK